MENEKIKGNLIDGINYGNSVFKEFEIESLTAGTEMDAVDMCIAANKTGEGNLELARITATINIAGIPEVTFDMMRKMSVTDLNEISRVRQSNKKKEKIGDTECEGHAK